MPTTRHQHEGLDLRHERGGQAKYLEQPLYDRINNYMQRLADSVAVGHDLDAAMTDNMEDLSGQVEKLAPIEFGPLHWSGHPIVTSAGETVYDRAPITPRLTEAELLAESRARGGHPYGRRGRRSGM